MSSASTIVCLEARDIRFPTSRWLDGSDAMHPDPDYSAAYVVLRTDAGDGLEGHGLTFTIGRGNELCVAAARALEPLVVGRTLEGDRGRHARLLAQPRRPTASCAGSARRRASSTSPTAAVVNAVWDLWAKREGKPLWRLLADLTPEELVALRRLPLHRRTRSRPTRRSSSCCGRARGARAARALSIARRAIPPTRPRPAGSATTTRRSSALVRDAVAAGFTHVKMKVGPTSTSDDRRAGADPRGPRPGRRADDGREPGLGRRRGDRGDEAPAARSIPGGSRSRRAPTTCSATRGSAVRSRRSASRPASTSRTA